MCVSAFLHFLHSYLSTFSGLYVSIFYMFLCISGLLISLHVCVFPCMSQCSLVFLCISIVCAPTPTPSHPNFNISRHSQEVGNAPPEGRKGIARRSDRHAQISRRAYNHYDKTFIKKSRLHIYCRALACAVKLAFLGIPQHWHPQFDPYRPTSPQMGADLPRLPQIAPEVRDCPERTRWLDVAPQP